MAVRPNGEDAGRRTVGHNSWYRGPGGVYLPKRIPCFQVRDPPGFPGSMGTIPA